MKTIKSLKEITTLEVGDKIIFGNLEYIVDDVEYIVDDVFKHNSTQYYLYCPIRYNDTIFEILNLKKRDFVEKLGINADCNYDFPEVKSLEALTAIVSALFKEYEKQNELPKTWEEFCERNPIKDGEYIIDIFSNILETDGGGRKRDINDDKNYFITKKEAEAFLALMQLRQLRKCYVGDWEPDWTCRQLVYCVGYNYILNKCVIESSDIWGNCMSFPTEKLATQFLTNFKDLLEIAKPLL